ncbi:hypothetical protein Glove_309g118 [Diversispora epigaea]|uniref:Uncharacterized protein n=1 Tax=Diversispora epigaea TaxID=1348612 RepID=A0A397HZW8_9GLOM|nr:hypothetical protein Glove_309g118 [Diversispora epigaea]
MVWIYIGVGDENDVDLYVPVMKMMWVYIGVEENDVDLYWCRKWCGFMLVLVKKMVWIYIGAGERNGVDVGDENDVEK